MTNPAVTEEIHQAIRPIVLSVSAYWLVSPNEIMGYQQTRRVVRARQACYWLARRNIPNVSYPELARMFRRKEHTAVMCGCQRFEELLAAGDPAVTTLVNWATAPVGMAAE